MTWTICKRRGTNRLIGNVVSFTKCGSSFVCGLSEEVGEWLGAHTRADWAIDNGRTLVSIRSAPHGMYVLRKPTAGRSWRVGVNVEVIEAFGELLCGKRFKVTLVDTPETGKAILFSAHQHDAGVPDEVRPTPAMRAAGREAIAAYVQSCVAMKAPVVTDKCLAIGSKAGLTDSESNRAAKAAIAEMHEAQLSERRSKP
jgi:hypothetical protein